MFNLGNRLWHSDSSYRAVPAKVDNADKKYYESEIKPLIDECQPKSRRLGGTRGDDVDQVLQPMLAARVKPYYLHQLDPVTPRFFASASAALVRWLMSHASSSATEASSDTKNLPNGPADTVGRPRAVQRPGGAAKEDPADKGTTTAGLGPWDMSMPGMRHPASPP